MGLSSLSGHDRTDRALWIAVQRAHYRAFLDGRALQDTTGLGRSLSPAMTEDVSKTLTSARDMLFLLSRQGMLLLRDPRPQAKNKFLASWQRLQNILGSDNYLDILGKLWAFETQQCDEDLASLLTLVERYHSLFSSLLSEFD